MRRLRRHPVALFLVVTYAVTWTAWWSLAATGHVVTVGFSPWYLLGLVGPLAGAFAAAAVTGGGRAVRSLLARMVRVRTGARWWLVALGLPLGIALAIYAGGLLAATFGIGHAKGDFGAFNGFPRSSPLGMWLMLVLIGGLGEETGWRGFLLPVLQRRWSPLAASLLVGAAWALWHLPAFFVSETYRAMPAAMLPMFVLGIFCGSVFLAWLYNRGRSSILLVAVWHGTYNLLSGAVGARGGLAALETTAVMIVAAVLIARELHAMHLDRTGDHPDHAMAARP